MPKFIDLTGKVFSRWRVLHRGTSRNKRTYWTCQCDCGTIRDVPSNHLIGSRSKSCGCFSVIRCAVCGVQFHKDGAHGRFGHGCSKQCRDVLEQKRREQKKRYRTPERCRKYYNDNRENNVMRAREYRKKNNDMINARLKEKRQVDPEKYRESVRRWRKLHRNEFNFARRERYAHDPLYRSVSREYSRKRHNSGLNRVREAARRDLFMAAIIVARQLGVLPTPAPISHDIDGRILPRKSVVIYRHEYAAFKAMRMLGLI